MHQEKCELSHKISSTILSSKDERKYILKGFHVRRSIQSHVEFTTLVRVCSYNITGTVRRQVRAHMILE